jgi:hypothetical protein
MADPIRLLVGARSAFVRPNQQKPVAGILFRSEPLAEAMRLLSSGQYRVWFEPQWSDARILARRYPHICIYSIPAESYTESIDRTPAWRTKRHNGAVV